MSSLTAEELAAIDAALRAENRFEAIRLFRVATSSPLHVGVAFVEQRLQELAPAEEIPPPSLAAFLASSFGRKGELVGWWRNLRGEVCVLVLYQEMPTVEFELNVFPERVGSWGHDLAGYTLNLAQLQATLAKGGSLAGAEWAPFHPIVARLQSFLVALEQRLAPPRRHTSGTAVFLLDRESFEADYLFLPTSVPLAAWKNLQSLAGDEAEPIELSELGELVQLPPAAGSLIWASCRRQCCRQQENSQVTDTFFADLEAHPPAWQRLTPAALPAWEAFVGLGGVSGPRRQPLPWWLEAARKTKDSFAGLLGPAEARLIRRHQTELAALFAGSPLATDAERFLELICAAAETDGFCVACESGT